MKRFEELTSEQQREAIKKAISTLVEHLKSGIIIADKKRLTDREILKLAVVAAEESNYTDRGIPTLLRRIK
jgi:hypothetical protein